MTIKWDEINSVNVKEIDQQHQKLVAVINNFFTVGGNGKEALQKVVVELIEYANYHLSFEEDLFDKFHYEKSAEHKKQHQFYRDQVAEFQKEIENGDYQLIFTTMSKFLKEWWIFHINNSDFEYSDCFNKHGLY